MILFTEPLESVSFGRLRHILARVRSAREIAGRDLLAVSNDDPTAHSLALTFMTLRNSEARIEAELERRSKFN